jgi:hypothetical protein
MTNKSTTTNPSTSASRHFRVKVTSDLFEPEFPKGWGPSFEAARRVAPPSECRMTKSSAVALGIGALCLLLAIAIVFERGMIRQLWDRTVSVWADIQEARCAMIHCQRPLPEETKVKR